MVKMGDLLPFNSKKNLLQVIGKGDIIRMRLTEEEGIKPKNINEKSRNKYFIVLGKSRDGNLIGFAVINTKINTNLSYRLQLFHYPIKVKKYPFLEKDRYVYCGDLKEISMQKFSERYKCESFGKICDDDMELIITAIVKSGNISPKRLRKFGLIK